MERKVGRVQLRSSLALVVDNGEETREEITSPLKKGDFSIVEDVSRRVHDQVEHPKSERPINLERRARFHQYDSGKPM
jgi:hypothetical protein